MDYIEINPKIMVGKPVIKGTRITVENIIAMLGQGLSITEILTEYKGLKKEEILACLHYAENILEKTNVFDLDKIAS
jgi:uncharacterized protein (DUF433 family)